MSTFERVLLYLCVGALIAVAAQSAKATTINIGCGASCDTINFNPPTVGSCANGTQVVYQLSVGGQRKIWEWSGGTTGSWGLIQWDCPSCWTGDSLNWYNTHGYAPVTISVWGSTLLETFNVSSGAGSGTATQNIATSAVPSGCTAAPCGSDVTVTASWSGGAPEGAGVVANVTVGGFLVQISCDANGCNSGTFNHSQLNTTGSAPYNVTAGLDGNSWAICGVAGERYMTTPTIVSGGTTVACGATYTLGISANCATPTPSPTSSPSATPGTSPSVTPSPSATVPPAETPVPYVSPPPNNPGTSVTNGGTTMSGITNQDIYNDVKQALDDAGNRDSTLNMPNGSFSYGSNPSGENGTAGTNLQTAVTRFTDDLSGSSDGLMSKVDAIDSLTLPTSLGDQSTWGVSLDIPGGTLATTIDVSGLDTPVGGFRALCLAIMVVGAWFAMVKIIRSGVA